MSAIAADSVRDAPRAAATQRRLAWLSRYRGALVVGDVVAGAMAAGLAVLLRFGSVDALAPGAPEQLSYRTLALAFAVLWPLLLVSTGSYDPGVVGAGSEEFRRVLRAGVRFLALVGLVALLAKVRFSRSVIALALPLAVVLSESGRWLARRWLHAQRRRGRCLRRVVVVGSEAEALHVLHETARAPHAGLEVVGLCTPGPTRSFPLVGRDVPHLGGPDDVLAALERTGADTVAVAGGAVFPPGSVRRLAWELEGSGADLVVAPALTDVAGPRIAIRPVAGLPLLSVDQPEFTGGRRLLKSALDRGLALVVLLVLSPLLLLIAAAVALSSRGPVLFRQTRVGQHGERFTIWKYRTMRVGSGLDGSDNDADGPLFKLRRDPRVTPVGRWLRRFSLDELPQLLNVVGGSMSLVGPRPPLPGEVEGYGRDAHRRLLVKPGVTGLWQVSGRSDLSWDESVRLDLYYVENWSPALDLVILLRTVVAVVAGRGAY